jgi:GNAT superfamily N-acetyltransferase
MTKKRSAPTIRPVRPEDYDSWKPLWDEYNAFYERTVADEVTQTSWRRFFDAHEPVYCIVAERDGKLLGLCHYLFHRSTSQLEPVCYLQDLLTHADERGHGIGRALILAVFDIAREQGCKSVYWLTHTTNTPGRTLYDKVAKNLGFIEYFKDL